MSKISNQEKSSMITEIARITGVDMSSMMAKYENQYFKDSSINKLEFFREVFTDTLTGPSTTFLQARCDFPFIRDRRSPVDYGVELAFGWIMEDVILYALASEGIEIEMQGLDKTREYLEREHISSRSDYSAKLSSGVKSLELVTAWGDYWNKTDTLDLRQSKFKSMTTKLEGTIALGIEASTTKAFVLDMKKVSGEFEIRENPAWGGKAALSLYGMNQRMISIPEAIKLLKSL